MPLPKYKVTATERKLIERIADRYVVEFQAGSNLGVEKLDVVMDLELVHSNCYRLALEELWLANQFNFLHDVGGIRRNLNRKTGQLENCFRPRFIR